MLPAFFMLFFIFVGMVQYTQIKINKELTEAIEELEERISKLENR